jgi:hypothetical protein
MEYYIGCMSSEETYVGNRSILRVIHSTVNFKICHVWFRTISYILLHAKNILKLRNICDSFVGNHLSSKVRKWTGALLAVMPSKHKKAEVEGLHIFKSQLLTSSPPTSSRSVLPKLYTQDNFGAKKNWNKKFRNQKKNKSLDTITIGLLGTAVWEQRIYIGNGKSKLLSFGIPGTVILNFLLFLPKI